MKYIFDMMLLKVRLRGVSDRKPLLYLSPIHRIPPSLDKLACGLIFRVLSSGYP